MGSASDKAKAIALAASILAAPVTAQYEGLRLRTYLDPVGIPTICYGETLGVKPNQVLSKPECDNMLSVRLGYFALQIEGATATQIPVQSLAAFSSFSYNVGINYFKTTTLFKKLNAGDITGACRQLPRYIYAGKKILPGLIKRRDAEMELCLTGVLA